MSATDPNPLEDTEGHLEDLERAFFKAMQLRESGDEAGCAEALREILKAEPRLAEPRLELAHILLMENRFEEAEEHARLAATSLRAGGQWTKDVDPSALLSFALNMHGETIARHLEEGDLFLTDREQFEARWNSAAALFGEAAALDPNNAEARRNATRFARLD